MLKRGRYVLMLKAFKSAQCSVAPNPSGRLGDHLRAATADRQLSILGPQRPSIKDPIVTHGGKANPLSLER
jgi:hypothetical protein